MRLIHKFIVACIPLAGLAACGGGDTEDRLDVADPQVRFIHAAPTAPAVTLYRDTVAQSDATNTNYRFASNYFDVSMSSADWTVRTAAALSIGGVRIDPSRGNKYTVIAFATSATTNGVYLIDDPYNKPLGSSSTRMRLMNASYGKASVDFYINAPGTDINAAGVNPRIAAVAFNTAGPASGSDSVDVPGGNYTVTITTAGTKTVLFRGSLSFDDNRDILLLTVPNPAIAGGIKLLAKTEGTAGTTEVSELGTL